LLAFGDSAPEHCAAVAVSQPMPANLRLKSGDVWKGRPTVSFNVTEKGKVQKLKLLKSSGIPDIDREVLRTVRKWKYKPEPGCQPVEVEMTITIDFR
ncbi:MAG TPA: energy transducer TonB, partial [Candidatus Acidoferrales bacterium]|nr:energy transducer TonB [Candidatus Acidoferrales bacterium]